MFNISRVMMDKASDQLKLVNIVLNDFRSITDPEIEIWKFGQDIR